MNKEHQWKNRGKIVWDHCRRCGQDWNTDKPTIRCSCFKMKLPKKKN